jgi:S1-C subfamily serine protease
MQFPDAIDKVRDSVVQITYTITGLGHARLKELGARGAIYSMPLGTGFVVSDKGYVVTAKHVIAATERMREDVPEGNHIVGVGFAHPNTEGPAASWSRTFRVISYDVIGCDDRNDLALLRVRRNPFEMALDELQSSEAVVGLRPAAASLRISRPRDGTPIVVAGYPLGEAALVSTAGIIASGWSVDLRNMLVADGKGGYEPPDLADRYLADVQANGGNSGGPVCDVSDCGVVGVLVATHLTPIDGSGGLLHASADLALVIPSRYVAELADNHGVAWNDAESSQPG